jgi:hypothetical protein
VVVVQPLLLLAALLLRVLAVQLLLPEPGKLLQLSLVPSGITHVQVQ